MKVFGLNYNGIMDDLFPKLPMTLDPREADAYLLWQDVLGAGRTLCEINRDYFGKPVTVVQHGRGAMRDYLPPASFRSLADTLCVWGPKEKAWLDRAGVGHKAVITGSPLKARLKARKPAKDHQGVNIVYVPVIADHERPENVEWYYALKQIEVAHCIERLQAHREALRAGWHAWNVQEGAVTDGSIPWDILASPFRVFAKLAQVHDKRLYFGEVCQSSQMNKTHIDDCIKLLQYTDVVVGVEEGTFQLLAMAMDIPVVMIEGFTYGHLGGIATYDRIEMIRTAGAAWTDVAHLRETVEYALAHPESLRDERRQVVEEEFCPPEIVDPVGRIVEVVLTQQEVTV